MFTPCRKRQKLEHGLNGSDQSYSAICCLHVIWPCQPPTEVDRAPAHAVGDAAGVDRIAAHSHDYVQKPPWLSTPRTLRRTPRLQFLRIRLCDAGIARPDFVDSDEDCFSAGLLLRDRCRVPGKDTG